MRRLCRAPVLILALLSWRNGSPQEKWLDVLYVHQVKAGCGAAAVAMVIQYWARQYPALNRVEADSERIDRMLPASTRGIQGQALKTYFEKQGFSAFIFDGEISDLEHHIQKGRPVIVCLSPKGPGGPLHYAVVDGLDEKSVWMNDPARGKLFREDLDQFLRDWNATGNWALLAVPRQAE